MNELDEQTLDGIVQEMIRDKVTPGGVLLVERNGKIFERAYGRTDYEPDATPITTDTIYDIASVTKAVTATAALMLLDRGQLKLDAALEDFFASTGFNRRVSVFHLLTHTSGIGVQMSKLTDLTSDELFDTALNAPLVSEPGLTVQYTNVNSFLLGKIVEHISGRALDTFLAEELFRPLDLEETLFNPPSRLLPRIAPTEIDERRGLIRGRVHDESADALGGIAGHAGLFSTARDLRRFCRLWLNEGEVEGRKFFSRETAHHATARQIAGDISVGYGWMLDRAWMGACRSHAYGHTGFTGPAILIAPEHRLCVVWLCNRTYPRRNDKDRHAYTARMMDSIHQSLSQKA